MRREAADIKSAGKTIGLVPTMGYFHEGHLSLMRRGAAENDVTIVSLFVNPTQFGASEDLERYPRDLERDRKLAGETGANILFTPTNDMMYPSGYRTYVAVEEWSKALCGASRPVHFRGVTTVCNKLFNLCRPDRAYFGLKDAQQYLIIKKMVDDLNMNLELVPMPTVREPDGLAMSSRNVYLNPEQRQAALLLNKSLKKAAELIDSGQNDAKAVISAIRGILGESPLIRIDYVEAVCTDTLKPADAIKHGTLIALAAYLGETRLIDNLIV
jgi:pantoate--beta-alanine ligase